MDDARRKTAANGLAHSSERQIPRIGTREGGENLRPLFGYALYPDPVLRGSRCFCGVAQILHLVMRLLDGGSLTANNLHQARR